MPTLTELKLLVDWTQDDYTSLRQSSATPEEIEAAKIRAIKAQLIFDRECKSVLESLALTESENKELNQSLKELKTLGL